MLVASIAVLVFSRATMRLEVREYVATSRGHRRCDGELLPADLLAQGVEQALDGPAVALDRG